MFTKLIPIMIILIPMFTILILICQIWSRICNNWYQSAGLARQHCSPAGNPCKILLEKIIMWKFDFFYSIFLSVDCIIVSGVAIRWLVGGLDQYEAQNVHWLIDVFGRGFFYFSGDSFFFGHIAPVDKTQAGGILLLPWSKVKDEPS